MRYPRAQRKRGAAIVLLKETTRIKRNAKVAVVIDVRLVKGVVRSQAFVTDDGLYMIIRIDPNFTQNNMLYYYNLTGFDSSRGAITPKPLFEKLDAKYDYIDHDDDSMLILTNHEAPKFKLLRVSLKNGSVWDVVPEHQKFILDSAKVAAHNRLVLLYLDDVKHTLHVHDLQDGAYMHSLNLIEGSIDYVVGKKSQDEIFFVLETMIIPSIVYRVDFSSNTSSPKLEELRRSVVEGINEEDFLVQQVFFSSKDGTKVPMYIVSSKNSSQSGDAPVLLYGYGGK
ncbi:unnamed protein product [Cylicocyclus nassatus]|uniref:Peptidase S9A N-terminal domain-containing protein n=1 Tax=Cylicocyclus nassatus TaxID=53992 RepID=A0AA36MFW0_CYLNA|nr:unnamed protein product [Cylicocyclus nassatus]